jgi:hypothetical protein
VRAQIGSRPRDVVYRWHSKCQRRGGRHRKCWHGETRRRDGTGRRGAGVAWACGEEDTGQDLYRSAKEGPQYMAYAQPHPRLSVVSTSSQSSADHLSPTTTSTRLSLPSKAGPNRPNIYDRNLNKTRASEVSASAFTFLFSEIVQYTQKRVSGINDLERQ